LSRRPARERIIDQFIAKFDGVDREKLAGGRALTV
jgi:hypothetical protein